MRTLYNNSKTGKVKILCLVSDCKVALIPKNRHQLGLIRDQALTVKVGKNNWHGLSMCWIQNPGCSMLLHAVSLRFHFPSGHGVTAAPDPTWHSKAGSKRSAMHIRNICTQGSQQYALFENQHNSSYACSCSWMHANVSLFIDCILGVVWGR